MYHLIRFIKRKRYFHCSFFFIKKLNGFIFYPISWMLLSLAFFASSNKMSDIFSFLLKFEGFLVLKIEAYSSLFFIAMPFFLLKFVFIYVHFLCLFYAYSPISFLIGQIQ